jgi:hypothetical protein
LKPNKGVCGAKFLVTKFEFLGSFDMSFEKDCQELEFTPNLKMLCGHFGVSLERVKVSLQTDIYVIRRGLAVTKNFLKKAPSKLLML